MGSLCIKGQILYQFAMELENHINTSSKKIISRLLINVAGIYLMAKILGFCSKAFFFFFFFNGKSKFYNGPQSNSQTLGDRN